MPQGDRTGPRGLGPLTGRGLGNCVIELEPNQELNNRKNINEEDFFRGRGMGFGRGFNRRRFF